MSKPLLSDFQLLLIKAMGLLPLCVGRALGTFLGFITARITCRNHFVTRANINLCFPTLSDKQKQAKVRASLKHTAILPFETCVVWSRSQEWVNKRVVAVEGEAVFTEALAKKKGVICVAPHLGNWEVVGTQLPSYATPTCMYQPPKQAFLDEFIYQKRESYGMHLAPTNARGVAKCLKALKKGELVAILPDQNPASPGGGFAPFFGLPTYTMTLLHGLIKRTNCKVVMTFAMRVDNGFKLYFLEPDADIYSEDESTSLAGLNKSVELCVNLCPDQYQWEYKRFKQRPEGEPPLYVK